MSCGCEDNSSGAVTRAGRLNAGCFCRTLDEGALLAALNESLGDLAAPMVEARPHLFSRAPVFLSVGEVAELRAVVAAIEELVRHPSYQRAALAWAPEIAQRDLGPRGALMGYDFHLTAEGPRLIEVNTNAGGAFLNALAGAAQRVCCAEAGIGLAPGEAEAFAGAARDMFAREWSLQGRAGALRRMAIVDDAPAEQHLYPEFLIAQRVLTAAGVEVLILDPADLSYRDGVLSAAGAPIDLVYNRLVDFALDEPRHAALGKAYLDGAVVVTPNPHLHALYADKRDLILFSDLPMLSAWGVSVPSLEALKAVPLVLFLIVWLTTLEIAMCTLAVMIWRSAPDALCDWFNKPWLDFVGRTMEQELGNGWTEGVHPDDLDRCMEIYRNAFEARQCFTMVYRLRRADGAYRQLLDNGKPFYRDGEFAG